MFHRPNLDENDRVIVTLITAIGVSIYQSIDCQKPYLHTTPLGTVLATEPALAAA